MTKITDDQLHTILRICEEILKRHTIHRQMEPQVMNDVEDIFEFCVSTLDEEMMGKISWTKKWGWRGITPILLADFDVEYPYISVAKELERIDGYLRRYRTNRPKPKDWMRYIQSMLRRANNAKARKEQDDDDSEYSDDS